MSLFKRRVTRRAAGVGVGVALLMLGVEAPAMAVQPTITGLSPTSGPVDCVVTITGTGFDQAGAFALDTVKFTGTNGIDDVPADFHVVSDTELWTTVPAGAMTGAITVTNGQDEFNTSGVFTVTSGAGGCAPTIASFTPTCGVVGTQVTITGTNLLKSSGDDTTSVDPAGANVRFNPYLTNATHTGAAESPTTVVVNVTADAVTGPIRVDTAAGPPVLSTDSFTVATDPAQCEAPTPVEHSRSISLKLRKHLIAKGRVSVSDDFTECASSVRVKIQKRKAGHWKTIKLTTTSSVGKYAKRIKDKPGKYRALAPKVTLESGDVCLRAKSPARKHRH